MENRILLLGPEQHARIAAVKAHAEANVIAFVCLYRMAQSRKSVPLASEHIAQIPEGYRVGYTIEEQQCGTLRHFTASVDGQTNLVHPVAVEALLEAFGMPKLADALLARVEGHTGKEGRNLFHVFAEYMPAKT